MRKNLHNLGQSMFELLVAVFVIAVSLTAIVSLVTSAVSNTTFSRDRTQATKYAQEAVEWLRSERDQDWGLFRSRASGSERCLRDLSWTSACDAIPQTAFTRVATLRISGSDPNSIEAIVVVRWSDQSGNHESRVTTYFTNWRTR